MSLVKVIEVLAQSPEGYEEAVREAVSEASKTIRNILSVYVKDFQAVVENGQVVAYRVAAKISFAVER